MNLVEYFCSVGSLVSMWFGIRLHDIALFFGRESKKKIIYLFGFMKYELIIITLKIYKTFPKMTIIIFSILTFYQIFTVITYYFDYEIVTCFEIVEFKQYLS